MRRSMKPSLVFLLIFSLAGPLFSVEADILLDELMSREKSPRLLNSEDIQIVSSTPLPLFSPIADFNNDGIIDMALSGIYNLPGTGLRYFLLVGSEREKPRRAERLFFKEYAQPVFIHKPGTTGDADPGDQSFSISFCLECDQGFDFYWNKTERKFTTKAWKAKLRWTTALVAEEAVQVPMETVDAALKIVGDLKDVQDFVARLKKEGKELKTRVDTLPGSKKMDPVLVKIYEKKESGDILYETFTVNVAKKRILNRKKGKKS